MYKGYLIYGNFSNLHAELRIAWDNPNPIPAFFRYFGFAADFAEIFATEKWWV